jgi:hypothetical protein
MDGAVHANRRRGHANDFEVRTCVKSSTSKDVSIVSIGTSAVSVLAARTTRTEGGE